MKLTTILAASLLLVGNSFAGKKPNVILIYADDLGYGDLSCYGATKVKTPRIDSLATGGRLFTDGHSPSAVCTPSRYSLLTGQYPFRKNIYAPIFLKKPLIIPEDTFTVADLMKEAGYKTGIVGKWHLGFQDKAPVDWNAPLKPGPLELGFDYYYGVPTVNSHPPFVYVENHHVVGHIYDPESPDYDPFSYDEDAGKQGYTKELHEKMNLDDIGGSKAAHALYKDEEVGLHLAGKAVDWIDANKEDPFFLIFASTHIHHPFTPAPQFQGTSEAGPYGDFLQELDHIVGMILDKLDAEGLTDDTLIIFTADNGAMLNETAQEAWKLGHHMNGPLLGFKSDAWEGGHRVPFIAKWPGSIPAGTRSDQLICAIDLMATMSTFTGTPLPSNAYKDGIDMSEAFTGNPGEPIRDHLVCAPLGRSFLMIRKGKWAYLAGKGSAGWNKATGHVVSGPRSTMFTGYENSDTVNGVISKDAPPAQLYDLEKDLSQTTNVYNEYPEVVKELDALLETYKAPAKRSKRK
ncbi:sulfatase family protein [Luteolibacter sp. AS25]|uniref:sulfatase family protein n=1 Tax=Luteolibacter sp. AS25 TaxID=3135776 RepID=UPI00398A802D